MQREKAEQALFMETAPDDPEALDERRRPGRSSFASGKSIPFNLNFEDSEAEEEDDDDDEEDEGAKKRKNNDGTSISSNTADRKSRRVSRKRTATEKADMDDRSEASDSKTDDKMDGIEDDPKKASEKTVELEDSDDEGSFVLRRPRRRRAKKRKLE